MLDTLQLTEVGPIRQVEWALSQRLNLLTGDNGLGKTFLLECAWWALTGTWAKKYQVYPRHAANEKEASIAFRLAGKSQARKLTTAKYELKRQDLIERIREIMLF